MPSDHLYVVVYDISEPKRWRRVFKIMKSFGEWLQLSVFQCMLSQRQLLRMEYALKECIKNGEDHVLIIDIGPSDKIRPRFKSLGKTFEPLERKPVIF